MGDLVEWSAPAGVEVAAERSSAAQAPRPQPTATTTARPPESMHGTIVSCVPIMPGLYRLLIDYQRLLQIRREKEGRTDDPVRVGMTGIVPARAQLSFVIQHAVAGHAIATLTAPNGLPKITGAMLIINPAQSSLEALERFRQTPVKPGQV